MATLDERLGEERAALYAGSLGGFTAARAHRAPGPHASRTGARLEAVSFLSRRREPGSSRYCARSLAARKPSSGTGLRTHREPPALRLIGAARAPAESA